MSIRGLTNCKLVSWTPHTGDDSRGVPIFDVDQLPARMSAIFSQPRWGHVQTAQVAGIEVMGVILLAKEVSGLKVGDRVGCDFRGMVGKILQVTRAAPATARRDGTFEIFVIEVAA